MFTSFDNISIAGGDSFMATQIGGESLAAKLSGSSITGGIPTETITPQGVGSSHSTLQR